MAGFTLHIGGASTASVIVSLAVIFLLMLIMSFAFWRGPQEERRFSGPWFAAWIKASTPRIIVAALFCAGLFVASSLSNGSDTTADTEICGRNLPPLTDQTITDERIVAGVDGLRELAEAARDGDVERVRVLIFSDAHNITHDIDAALRPIDADLARNLCESVLRLENEALDSDSFDPDATAEEAERAAALLEQARPIVAGSTATPDVSSDPVPSACDNPVGAVSDEPLTAARVQDAISAFEAVAQAAESGDAAAATQVFFGRAHDITHDIDGPLREADVALARQLCASVLELEIQLAGRYEMDVIETEAQRSAALLDQAQEALGLE